MLAGRDQERTYLARTTQLGEYRRELNALGARTDDEGERGHLKSRKGGLKRGHEGRRTRGSAKVQIGAKLLCKSAKVRLNFQVSGLGSREPGSGVQVRVQVQDLNVTPHLYLITRT